MVLAASQVVADDIPEAGNQSEESRMWSDKGYQQASSFRDLMEILHGLGLTIDDVSTHVLAFESDTFQDCLSQVERTSSQDDELAIGFAACMKRHSDWDDEMVRKHMESINQEEKRRR
jgi:hypothetical protein